MTEAEKILALIEDVDPSDTAKMDEIDWLVDRLCYPCWKVIKGSYGQDRLYKWEDGSHERQAYLFTRSRDALKAIRPKDYGFLQIMHTEDGKAYCQIKAGNDALHSPDYDVRDGEELYLPTEELAELHAIIQAIEWERKNVKSS